MDNDTKGAGIGVLMGDNKLLEEVAKTKAILDQLLAELPAPVQPELSYAFRGFRWEGNRLYMILVSSESIHTIPIEINQLHLIVHDAAEILQALPSNERIIEFGRADTLH